MSTELKVPKSEEEAAENRAALTTTKTKWKKAAVHPGVVCPSGEVIAIKLPNVATLAKNGEIPNELVDIATTVSQVGLDKAPPDALEKLADFQQFLVAATVHEPKITVEEVPDLPAEDIEFLQALAFRQRDYDALGNSIAGLDKLANYATFRPDNDSDEVALDS